jgi:hypothetical protein
LIVIFNTLPFAPSGLQLEMHLNLQLEEKQGDGQPRRESRARELIDFSKDGRYSVAAMPRAASVAVLRSGQGAPFVAPD